jgi:hypothetical protein
MEDKPGIPSHEALRIANEDARAKYRELEDLRVEMSLHSDGWHVEFWPRELIHGGGPHYVIDSGDGRIISKKYYQ